ncbi:MAG: M50 family metallopeptidase [Bdellovibrionales bacterium]|nr:M50 family metallopeptidase [Bdellovibrionales bacterium]
MALFKRKKYEQPEIDVSKKSGSLAFYIAIPVTIIISLSTLVTLVSLFSLGIWRPKPWLMFLYGFVFSCGIFTGSGLVTLKTLIHELKHAAVVILTGNKLTELRVYRDIGHVSYEMYRETTRFIPFIILAPYCFPLFSLPALIAALILEAYAPNGFACLLGAALACDLVTAYQDLHPHQSDLQRIFGGVKPTYAFIFGVNLMWFLLCMIWLVGGTTAYVYAGYHLLRMSEWIVYSISDLYKRFQDSSSG